MNNFTDELLVESQGNAWVLKRAFHFYYIDEVGSQIDVVVPEKFITDFVSTPKILYSFFPPIGIYNKAAIMHDYLYSKDCPIALKRVKADKFFLQAMEVLHAPKWQRKLMYFAVRLFGKKYFRV
jgi:hypothetical protein